MESTLTGWYIKKPGLFKVKYRECLRRKLKSVKMLRLFLFIPTAFKPSSKPTVYLLKTNWPPLGEELIFKRSKSLSDRADLRD